MFNGLKKLLGVVGDAVVPGNQSSWHQSQVQQGQHPEPRMIPQAPQYQHLQPKQHMQRMPQPGGAEDDGLVQTAHGQVPLWAVNPGTPWTNSLGVAGAFAPRSGADFNGIQQSSSFDDGLQGYNQDDLSNGLQGGTVNQGYIPLQSGGAQPRFVPRKR